MSGCYAYVKSYGKKRLSTETEDWLVGFLEDVDGLEVVQLDEDAHISGVYVDEIPELMGFFDAEERNIGAAEKKMLDEARKFFLAIQKEHKGRYFVDIVWNDSDDLP